MIVTLHIDVNRNTGEINSVVLDTSETKLATDITQDLAYYDNGTRGWRITELKDFRVFLQEESTDNEEVI